MALDKSGLGMSEYVGIDSIPFNSNHNKIGNFNDIKKKSLNANDDYFNNQNRNNAFAKNDIK